MPLTCDKLGFCDCEMALTLNCNVPKIDYVVCKIGHQCFLDEREISNDSILCQAIMNYQWSNDILTQVRNRALEFAKASVVHNAYEFPQISGSHIVLAIRTGSLWETRTHEHDRTHI